MKHWQLFIWTFGAPVCTQIIIMVSMISNISHESNPEPEQMYLYFKFIPIITFIFMVTFFTWFWAIAIGLQKKVPAHIPLNTILFKILFFIVLIYSFFYMIGFLIIMSGIFQTDQPPDFSIFRSLFWIILPIHLFSVFCVIYATYLVAKTFKTAELQRAVKFTDFAGEFLMLWFFPIGIWFIQPKINKMVEE
ncbi:MAG: hypothetical protein Q8M15_14950 [Bacteroidota bacterium]|nr:hypothetical protein [Bacteroidota bacterium]